MQCRHCLSDKLDSKVKMAIHIVLYEITFKNFLEKVLHLKKKQEFYFKIFKLRVEFKMFANEKYEF